MAAPCLLLQLPVGRRAAAAAALTGWLPALALLLLLLGYALLLWLIPAGWACVLVASCSGMHKHQNHCLQQQACR
jgi:hypothetical protein